MYCFVCGSPIILKTVNKFPYAIVGRPKNYCSDNCRNFQKYFNAMRKHLQNIDLDDKHKLLLTAELFKVVDTLNFASPGDIGTKRPQDIDK